MNEHHENGFVIREFTGKRNFARWQIGEYRNHFHSKPFALGVCDGYRMMSVEIFHVRAFGATLAEAKEKLNL